MTWWYIAFGLIAIFCIVLWAAYRWGGSKQKAEDRAESAEEGLKRAKIAKDVRNSAPLDDKWLRRRD